MLMWTDYLGIGFVLALLVLVFRDYRRRLFLWPRVTRHSDLESWADDNLLLEAKESVKIFSGCLHRELGTNVRLSDHMAKKMDCIIEVLVGPDVDIAAVPMLRAIIRNPRIRFFVVREDARNRFQTCSEATTVPRRRFRHFLVADRRHVNIEESHRVCPIQKKPPRQLEVKNVPTLARFYARRFEAYRDHFSHKVDKSVLIKDIQEYGRWVCFEEEKMLPANKDQLQQLAGALAAE